VWRAPDDLSITKSRPHRTQLVWNTDRPDLSSKRRGPDRTHRCSLPVTYGFSFIWRSLSGTFPHGPPTIFSACRRRTCRETSRLAADRGEPSGQSSWLFFITDELFALSARADQVLNRDRYVAKTTTVTATQATMYSVEVSPLALLIAVSRAKAMLFTTKRITYPPCETLQHTWHLHPHVALLHRPCPPETHSITSPLEFCDVSGSS